MVANAYFIGAHRKGAHTEIYQMTPSSRLPGLLTVNLITEVFSVSWGRGGVVGAGVEELF